MTNRIGPIHIASIFIDHFFELQSISLTDLTPGLNLIYGPNEAGKSTILRFIRSVLYGFDNRYPRDWGGRIVIRGPSGTEITLERKGGRKEGYVSLYDEDGRPLRVELLNDITRGVGKVLFSNCFAFGLGELETVKSLRTKDVEEAIFAATSGISPGTITRMRRYLDKVEGELFKPQGKLPPINKLLSQLKSIERAISEKEKEIEGINTSQNRISVLEDEANLLGDEIEAHRKRLEHLILIEELFKKWLEYLSLKRELEGLPGIPLHVESGIGERLSMITELIEKGETELERALTEYDSLKGRLEQTRPLQEVLEAKDAIRALSVDLQGVASALDALTEKEKRVEFLRERLETTLAQLGPGIDPDTLDELDTSMLFRQKVWDRYKILSDLQEREKAIQNESTRLSQEKEAIQSKIRILQRDIEVRRELVEGAKKIKDEALHLKRRKNEIEEEERRLDSGLRSAKRYSYALLGMGILLLLGLFGVWTRGDFPLSTPIIVTLLGALILDALLYIKKQRNIKGIKYKIESLKEDQNTIFRQTDALLSHLNQGLTRLDPKGATREEISLEDPLQDALVEVYVILEKERQNLSQMEERLKEMQRQISQLEEELRGLDERLIELRKKTSKEEDILRALLVEIGLKDIPRETVFNQYMDVLERAKEIGRECESLKGECASLRDTVDLFLERAKGLFDALGKGCPESPKEVVREVMRLKELLLKEEGKKRLIEEIEEALKVKEKEISIIREKIKGHRETISKILDQVGAKDQEDFFKKLSMIQEIKEKETRLKALEIELNQIGQDFHKTFSGRDRDSLRYEIQRLRDEIEGLRLRRDELLKEIGSFNERMKRLVSTDELRELRTRREQIVGTLRELTRRWAIVKTAKVILEQAKRSYEEKSQPEVLRTGSKFFSIFTHGRYSKVYFDIERHGIRVQNSFGGWKEVAELSRGTREQLFLALRFGYILSLANGLPVIMDDILVNFDSARMKSAVQAILELSSQRQVLFLTCHPEVTTLFEEAVSERSDGLNVSFKTLPMNAQND